MSSVRLSKATKELNISLDRAVEELAKQGHEIPNNRNHKITDEQYEILMTAFADDLARKKRSEAVTAQVKEEKDLIRGETDETTALAPVAEDVPTPAITVESLKEESPETKVDEASNEDDNGPKVLGKIDIEDPKPKKKESQKAEPKAKSEKTSEENPKAEASTSAAKETNAETEISTKYVKLSLIHISEPTRPY